MLFQAILFYFPRIIWRCLNVKSGLNLVNIVDAAIKYENVDKFNDRDKIMSYIISNIERYIGARKNHYEFFYGKFLPRNPKYYKNSNYNKKFSGKQLSDDVESNKNHFTEEDQDSCDLFWHYFNKSKKFISLICFWSGKHLGNYLTILYIFVKTLWLTNAISQLFLLNRFIGNDYHAFGLDLIQMLIKGQDWNELKHFPRVTYCDFKIREIGNIHDWTVQCVLRINLFNEVIFIFMWYWLCLLVICILMDYINWLFNLLISGSKLRFIKRHLDVYHFYSKTWNSNEKKINERDDEELDYFNDMEREKKLLKDFTFDYLKDDCVFAMRILASNTSDIIVTEIVNELWKNYKKNVIESNEALSSRSKIKPKLRCMPVKNLDEPNNIPTFLFYINFISKGKKLLLIKLSIHFIS